MAALPAASPCCSFALRGGPAEQQPRGGHAAPWPCQRAPGLAEALPAPPQPAAAAAAAGAALAALAGASRCKGARSRRRRLAALAALGAARRRLLLGGLAGGCGGLAGDVPRAGAEAAGESLLAKTAAPLALAVAGKELASVPSEKLEERLAAADVVLLGEHHNSVADHELELAVVQALNARAVSAGRPLAVGLEMVQQRFQGVLDAYGRGELGDQGLFEATEWAIRWSWPYELYLPIFRFCKEAGIRLVALNADSEALGKVERGGLEELAPEDWQRFIPDRKGFAAMGKAPEFKAYLAKVVVPSYRMHERMGILKQTVTGQVLDSPMPLRNFVGGRLLWDETMAGAAARAASGGAASGAAGRGAQVCVLIGGDHVKFRYGVRERMERIARQRASPLDVVSVMLNPTSADTLAPPGSRRLSLSMEVPIQDGGGAEAAGRPREQGAIPLADFVLVSQEVTAA